MCGAEIKASAARLVEALAERGLMIATAESCTGGAVAAAVTSIAGCSAVMLGGVVAYHNDVKVALLGVDEGVLLSHGAVSEPVVAQMANGVALSTGAACAVATSGIAGPGGGTPDKPVGTVWVAVKVRGNLVTRLLQLPDRGREENIRATVLAVLEMACGMVLSK